MSQNLHHFSNPPASALALGFYYTALMVFWFGLGCAWLTAEDEEQQHWVVRVAFVVVMINVCSSVL